MFWFATAAGAFLISLIKYGVWFVCVQSLKLRRLYIGGIAAGVIVLLLAAGLLSPGLPLIFFEILSVGTCSVMIDCEKKERGLYVLQAYFLLAVMEEILGSLIIMIFHLPDTRIVLRFISLTDNAIFIIIFGAGGFLKRKWVLSRNGNRTKFYRFGTYFIITSMIFTVYLSVSGFKYLANQSADPRFRFLCNAFTIFAYLCILFFILFMTYMFNANKKYKIYLEKDAQLLKMQKAMYEAMLSKNEETRRYRHDMQNHLMCLEELAGGNDPGKVRAYIQELEENLQAVIRKAYATGNSVIDAALNYYVSMLPDDVSLNIDIGSVPAVKMSDVELCTVISNLMQNAQEALRKPGPAHRFLTVEIRNIRDYVRIRISNSLAEEHISFHEKSQIPITKKSDPENHGIGMNNIKRAVEKNGGIFDLDIVRNEFTVTVLLPSGVSRQ